MRRGVRNVTWTLGQAEELQAPAGSFELITNRGSVSPLGSATHSRTFASVAQTGQLPAVIGCSDILSGRENWQLVAVSVAGALDAPCISIRLGVNRLREQTAERTM